MAKLQKLALIIENAADTRLIFRKMLEMAGIEVMEAASIEEAMMALARQTPHVIVLDLHMEGKDGFWFLQERRSKDILRRIPVIVVSGMNDQGSVSQALSFGANDYLLKPVKTQSLLMRVRRLLRSQDFASCDLSDRPVTARLSVPATLLAISDSSLLLKSPVRFGAKSRVELSAPVLENESLSSLVWSTGEAGSVQAGNGAYRSRVYASGAKSGLKKLLKKELK